MVTGDPTVYYNYPTIGNVTVKLKVVAEREQATLGAGKGIAQKTGDYSASLKLHGGSPGRGCRLSAPCSPGHIGLRSRAQDRVDCAPIYCTGRERGNPSLSGLGERGRLDAAADFSVVLWHTLTAVAFPHAAQMVGKWRGNLSQPLVLVPGLLPPASSRSLLWGRLLLENQDTGTPWTDLPLILGRGLGRAECGHTAWALGALRHLSLATRLTGSSLPFRNPSRHPGLGAYPN